MFILQNSILLLLLIFYWPIAEAGEGNRKWGSKENYDYDDYDNMQEEENIEDDNSDRGRDLQTEISINYFGSNLFQNMAEKPCFKPDDVGLLTARLDFEKLLPNSSVVKLENDKSVEAMLEYFYGTQEIVRAFSSAQPQLLSLQALSDLVGGYLNYIYVPLVKQSFYAGQLTYKSVNSVYELRNKCKTFLNTNGNGWRNPITDFSKFNFKIDAINVSVTLEPGPEQTPCVNLILNDEDNGADMIVSLPKLDEDDDPERLSGIWLPFKRKHNFNLMGRSSAFILIRYYVAVMKCYEFQGTSPKKFKNLFGKWISENILSFLDESDFYPGLGAVLRIVQTLNSDDPQYADDFVEAVPKGQTHKASPEYTQIQDQILKIQSNKKKSIFFENLLSADDEEKHKNALIITIMCGLGFAIFIACVAIVWTSCCVKKPKKSKQCLSNGSDNKFRRKWYNIFRRPFKQKKSDSEEVECMPDSPSIMSRRQEESFNRKIDAFDSLSSMGSTNRREPKDYMMRGGRTASRQAQEKLIRSSVLGQRPSQAPKVTKSSSIKSLRQRLKQSSNHHRRGREYLSISTSSSSSVTLSRAPSFREINEKSSIVHPQTDGTQTDTPKRTKQPTKIPIFRKLPKMDLCCGSVTPNRVAHRSKTFEITDEQQLAKKLDNVPKIETPVVLTRKKAPLLRCCTVRPKAASQSSWETLVSARR